MMNLSHFEIRRWLAEDDPAQLEDLWKQADEVRLDHVGDEVYLRGLIELSNACDRRCLYCGLRANNAHLPRYRMSREEILDCADEAVRLGYGTVVLQSGEEAVFDLDWMLGIIRHVKTNTPLAVTLSLGERSREELVAMKEAGADRYLLRFETSNRELFDRIHPPTVGGRRRNRLEILGEIREIGYEVGSGVMIGIPGQTIEDLVLDLETFVRIDLDMIGMGPFIAHPDTPLGQHAEKFLAAPDEQVAPTELNTYKMIALARLVCPRANIPATTALATLNRYRGRELGLMRGANIIMPNLTPTRYRAEYEIYPDKACIGEAASECATCVHLRIQAIGRTLGAGRGDSPNIVGRKNAEW